MAYNLGQLSSLCSNPNVFGSLGSSICVGVTQIPKPSPIPQPSPITTPIVQPITTVPLPVVDPTTGLPSLPINPTPIPTPPLQTAINPTTGLPLATSTINWSQILLYGGIAAAALVLISMLKGR